jgi:hypothetical protein
MSIFGSNARQVRAALAAAPDAALGRVVGMLDGMDDRDAADQLLADVRPRLRRLRPARPMRLLRLLALPLEGALVAPSAWKRAPFEIPRSALPPLGAAIRAALPAEVEEVEAAALGHSMAEEELVGRLGARIWAAAALLPDPPPGWSASALPREAAGPVLGLCRTLWRHGGALWHARLACPGGPSEALLRETLGPIVADGPAALAAAATLLVRHAAAPARVAWVAAGFAPPVAAVADRALSEALAADLAEVAAAATPGDLADRAAALEQRLADAEAHDGPAGREARRRQVAQLRREASEACLALHASSLRGALLDPAAQAAAGPRVGDATIEALETAARDLRRLRAVGRRLGQEAAFDRALAEAVPKLVGLGRWPRGLTRVEIARLIEILAEPEAALPLLVLPAGKVPEGDLAAEAFSVGA